MCPQLWTNDRTIMATDQKYKHISFRVSNDTWDLLTIDASIKNQGINLVARDLMLESLFKYDAKQEYLASRLDQLDEAMSKHLKLIALSVATSTLPLEQSGYEREKLRELIKTHLFDASALSKSILDMLDKGKL